MGAKELASQRKCLALYFGYILLSVSTAGLMMALRQNRTDAAPLAGECTPAPQDCPIRSFCYRKVEASIFGSALYNMTADDGTAMYSKADHDADGGLIRYVCACYALYGEGGVQPLPGGQGGDYCQEAQPYQGAILGACYVCLVIVGFSVFHMHLAMFQLVKVEALLFNASGITMVLTALASLCELCLVIVYLAELQGLTSPVYSMNDAVRPTIFGYFAVSMMSAMLQVSLMWADVYMKSKKMGADNDIITKLKRAVAATIFMSFIIVMGGLLTGLTLAAGGWAALVLIVISVAYFKEGKKLSQLLMPADASAPGASSAKAAADQILVTAKAIPFNNIFFIIFLGGHFVTVQRPSTKALSMICVFGFLIMAVAHQFRLLYYVKFGARKKLHKAGYKGFRSSLMSTMSSSSSVAPEDGKESAASTVSSE